MAKIFEHLWNGADSGVTPATVADNSGNGRAATIDFASGAAAWATNAQGRYLSITAAGRTSTAKAQMDMTVGGLGAAIEGKTTLTYIVKIVPFTNADGGDPWPPIVQLYDGVANALQIALAGGNILDFSALGAGGPSYGITATHWAIVLDTAQATPANRLKVYGRADDGTNFAVDVVANGFTFPAQNAAFSGLTGDTGAFLTYGNHRTGSNNGQGGIKYDRMEDVAFSQATIFAIFDALAANDDADPYAPPTLSWLAAPSVASGSQTASGYTINQTTSMAAAIDILVTPPGTTQPTEGQFDAATYGGNSVASTVFGQAITGRPASETRLIWVRAVALADPAQKIYQSVSATTLAVSNTILAINGGQPLKYGQTNIDITWDAVPGSLPAVMINGVAQTGHTTINSTTSRIAGPLVWPAPCMYNQTATLVCGSNSVTTPPIIPADGYSVQLLAGFAENPPQTIDTTGDAVSGDQIVYNNQGGALTLDALGRWTFGSTFNGLAEYAIVDQSDGTHSAFGFYPYAAGADVIPLVPTLITNVTGANPGQAIRGSFVLAGVDAGQDIPVVAAGFMQVSTTDGSGYGPSIARQLGQTVYYEIIAGAFGEVRTGNVSMNGVTAASPLSVTTRAANAPSFTTQAANQSVTSGAVATFTAAATNVATWQWQKDTAGNGVYANIPGATSATYARTTSDADLGTSNVRPIATSSEGASTPGASATLTVIAAATRLVIPAGVVTGRGASMAGATAVPINIRNVNGALIHSTTVTIAASGVTNIDSNQNGAIGTDRFVGFPSSVDGSEALIRLTVQAAS